MKLPFLFDTKALGPEWAFSFGEGFNSGSYVSPNQRGEKNRWVKLHNVAEDVSVVVRYTLKAVNPKDSNWGFDGTTTFDKGRTFDRTGVESSFTISDKRLKDKFYGRYTTLQDAALGELKRVQERAARIKAAGGLISVPGIGFSITADHKAELVKQLKQKGYISFTPSGFGTGYTFFTSNREARRYGTELATVEQKKFFSVNLLYYRTMDCD